LVAETASNRRYHELDEALGSKRGAIAALGVRRISLGCGLARAVWRGFVRAVKHIAEDGRFVRRSCRCGILGPSTRAYSAEDRKARVQTWRPRTCVRNSVAERHAE